MLGSWSHSPFAVTASNHAAESQCEQELCSPELLSDSQETGCELDGESADETLLLPMEDRQLLCGKPSVQLTRSKNAGTPHPVVDQVFGPFHQLCFLVQFSSSQGASVVNVNFCSNIVRDDWRRQPRAVSL